MPSSQQKLLVLTAFIIALESQILTCSSQQQYIDNLQLNCGNTKDNRTIRYVCNGVQSTCTAYLTFRSTPPWYATPQDIATLLSANASDIAQLNNISTVSEPIPADRVIVVPLSCGCSGTGSNRYYQHNATYRLREKGESYFSMANNTFQGLTTCQAMTGQNPFPALRLQVGEEFRIPLRCACPTAVQERRYSARFLLTYILNQGDFVSEVADMFGVDMQSVLDANEISADATIYFFTPILVPLQSVPANIKFSSPPLVPPPQSNPVPPPPPDGNGGGSKKWVFVGVGIGAGVLAIVVSFIFLWLFYLQPSKKAASSVSNMNKGAKKDLESAEYATLPGSYSSSSQNPKSWSVTSDGLIGAIDSLTVYKFAELQKATAKFSDANRIKGSVFRGKLNGDDAAIKILKGGVVSDEINLLKHINHSNIIRLSGYCIHEGNTHLVYEFAEKGSLDEWLFRQQSDKNSVAQPVIGWKERVQIACNVADALNYLHSYVNPPYIHKNLKSSNILLDANYRAKITNFGLARTAEIASENGDLRLTQHVVGTHGYLAREYVENGVVSTKLDVFAFGVLLLELISGKPAVFSSENKRNADNLLFKAIRKVFDGGNVREDLMNFMDTNLYSEYSLDSAYAMAHLAHKCVDEDMNSRPSMSEVSMTLSKIYSSLEL